MEQVLDTPALSLEADGRSFRNSTEFRNFTELGGVGKGANSYSPNSLLLGSKRIVLKLFGVYACIIY